LIGINRLNGFGGAMRLIVAVMTLVCALVWRPVGPLWADGAAQVGLVSDQVVHVHRVAKSACLVLSGAEPDVHLQDITRSSAAMRGGFLALASEGGTSDQSLIMAASRDGDVLVRAALQIAGGDRHSVAVAQMLRNGPLVTARMAAVDLGMRGPPPEGPSAELNAVHELRIKSQRLQQDLCLLRIGLAGARAANRLFRDAQSIPQLLVALRNGDPKRGLSAAASIHIKVELGKALAKWRSLAPIVAGATDGEMLDLRDVMIASVLVDAMLGNLDATIALYAER